MILAWLLLLTGLTISAVAIYYSVVGLAAIFSAAVIPIIVMGSALEVAKLVCASWLKANWSRAPRLMKVYMTTAVAVLMLITSMGIFGFLSKAHSDQSLVSGDVMSKISIYDEKIKTSKENIDANRKALKQMDEAVDQVMGRSADEKGADKAVALRRGQAKERTRLLSEITAEQKVIAQLSEERAPIAAEVRKVEAEVGPIKYIAAFIYGDNPDANILEKAVTWVIVIIVAVFDPLAVLMLLGAQMTLLWHRERSKVTSAEEIKIEEVVPAVVPVAVAANDDIDIVAEANAKIAEIEHEEPIFELPEEDKPEPIQCYKCGTELMDAPGIGPFCPNKQCDVLDATSGETIEIIVKPNLTWPFPAKAEFDVTAHAKTYKQSNEEKDIVDEVGVDAWNKLLSDAEEAVEAEKTAMRRWKEEHPDDTIKNVRQQKELGIIDELPWQDSELEDSKKKTTYIMKDGVQQVKRIRD